MAPLQLSTGNASFSAAARRIGNSSRVERAGGDPDGFGVSGTVRVQTSSDGRLDISVDTAGAASLASAGVTDLRMTHWPRPAANRHRDIRARLTKRSVTL